MQLEQYLALFDASQILVIDQHDLMHDRAGTLREVFRFLDVDEDFFSPDMDRRANRSDLREAFLSLTPAGRAVYEELAPRALEFTARLSEVVAVGYNILSPNHIDYRIYQVL